MPETDLFFLFTDRLGSLGARYMVTGSVAVIIYGEPRLTHDVDLVLELAVNDVEPLRKLFPDSEFYCPPAEIVRVELNRPSRGHFNLIHFGTGFKADVYLAGQDPLHLWALSNVQRIELEDHSIWVAPPEYVILRKLQFFREGQSEKHLRDIRSILAVSSAKIDSPVLEAKVRENELQAEWQMVAR
jgi:hypothetical protein